MMAMTVTAVNGQVLSIKVAERYSERLKERWAAITGALENGEDALENILRVLASFQDDDEAHDIVHALLHTLQESFQLHEPLKGTGSSFTYLFLLVIWMNSD